MIKQLKSILIDSVNQQFNGSGHTIPSALSDLAQSYGIYVEKDVEEFQVPQFVRSGL